MERKRPGMNEQELVFEACSYGFELEWIAWHIRFWSILYRLSKIYFNLHNFTRYNYKFINLQENCNHITSHNTLTFSNFCFSFAKVLRDVPIFLILSEFTTNAKKTLNYILAENKTLESYSLNRILVVIEYNSD